MAERRAALRLSREQSTLGIDTKAGVAVAELPTARRVLNDERLDGPELDGDPTSPTTLTTTRRSMTGTSMTTSWRTYEHHARRR